MTTSLILTTNAILAMDIDAAVSELDPATDVQSLDTVQSMTRALLSERDISFAFVHLEFEQTLSGALVDALKAQARYVVFVGGGDAGAKALLPEAFELHIPFSLAQIRALLREIAGPEEPAT